MIELYQQVFFVRDFPEYQLQKRDTATVVDTVSHPTGGEDGYVLEIFSVFGDSVDVITVPQSTVQELQHNQVFSVRSLSGVI
ncbi:hypothetical protein [Picosynechococcus sp. NKBG15041c]|uniref:hypothetical protein n=1 Tax=Picosynechococcus sp. NKBG15041c TaxID=1407650 RepID=UPI000426E906|nr:hypothetical protein [Picosynechococcus sp. NKBG15041c]